jgi:DNA-binding GntR family transcriptional regulator
VLPTTIMGMATAAGSLDASRPKPRPNLRAEVAAVVRDRILNGELVPGTRIDQDGLAADLGVSKLPVREALIQLEWMGLVETVPYRGSFVVELEPDYLRDTYRIYGMVCGLAAERAVTHLSSNDLDALGSLLDRIDDPRDDHELDEAHMEFHRRINRAGASRRMRRIIGQLLDSLPVRAFDFTPLWLEDTQREHRAILRLLRDRDGEAAASATAEHFIAGGERVVVALTERGYWGTDADDRGTGDGSPGAPGAS